jgi:hypothetical protein
MSSKSKKRLDQMDPIREEGDPEDVGQYEEYEEEEEEASASAAPAPPTFTYRAISHFESHLRDDVLLDSFRSAINCCPSLFIGAVVLDLTSSYGILAQSCVRAGATMVYVVQDDAEDASRTKASAKKNGFGDNVTVVLGPIEEFGLPADVGQVGTIIYLFFVANIFLDHNFLIHSFRSTLS